VAKRKLDFGGVDPDVKRGAGGGKHIPEADYIVKILEGTFHKGGEGKSNGYKWVCQVVKGPHKGVKLRAFTSLKPEALWSLRNLIFAATGKNVAGKSVSFDPDNLVGKIVGAEVVDNEYTTGTGDNKKTKLTSQINTFFPKDEANEAEEEDEEEDEDEDEEETEDEDEELEEVEVEDI
jgi:hypothetical protein